MLNYQRVKDFNQEGFYLQPLTRIGNYINSKKRDVKEHRGCHEPKYRVFFEPTEDFQQNTYMAQHDVAQFDFKDFLQ